MSKENENDDDDDCDGFTLIAKPSHLSTVRPTCSIDSIRKQQHGETQRWRQMFQISVFWLHRTRRGMLRTDNKAAMANI